MRNPTTWAIVAAWREAAAAIGYEHRSVLRPDQKQQAASRDERLEAAYQAALPVFDKELQRRAAVEGADARLAAAKGLIAAGVESPADVSAITKAMRERGVTQRGEATSLVWGDLKGENGRDKVGITTTLHRDEELWLVAAARAAGADKTSALTPAQIAAAVRRFPDLDFTSQHGQAQRAVMEQLGTGGRLTVAIGVAGSGKSTLLKPLVDAWKEDGRQVHGIALAWRQSDDLTDAGITARNARAVESFLKSVEKGRIRLGARSVVVVDELGLLGTRQLNDLLRAQKAARLSDRRHRRSEADAERRGRRRRRPAAPRPWRDGDPDAGNLGAPGREGGTGNHPDVPQRRDRRGGPAEG